MLGAYDLGYEKVSATIEDKEMEVGYLPVKAKGRVLDIKFLTRDENGAVLSIKE